MDPRARFERFVSPEPMSGCWLWTGYSNKNGYGVFGMGRKTVLAHRAGWEMSNGRIPDGLCVCHRCDNRACVNPAHLFLGTYADNTHDMMAKGRKIQPRGELHGRSKVGLREVAEIRLLRRAGFSTRSLAGAFGISQSNVSKISLGHIWKRAE